MNKESLETVDLPSTFLGSDRRLHIDYSHHGDLRFGLSNGDSRPGLIPFAHGSDVNLYAAFLGLLKYAGFEKDRIISVAKESLIGVEDYRYNLFNRQLWGVGPYINAIEATRFSKPEVNQICLVPGLMAQPGTFEEVGGTTIYLKTYEQGEKGLLFDFTPPRYSKSPNSTIEFCVEDSSAVIAALARVSMGEYRNDIFNIVESLDEIIE